MARPWGGMPRRQLVAIGAVTAAYLAAAKLGFAFAFVNQSVSPVWPPTGVALAALLILGRSVWPAIFVGAFLANYSLTNSLFSSLLIAGGNTGEGLVGAYLVTRYANGVRAFDRAQDTGKFALYGGMVSSTMSATIGVAALASSGYAGWSDYGRTWFIWWLGDLGGAVVVAPVLIEWCRHSVPAWSASKPWELGSVFGTLLVSGWIVFGPIPDLSAEKYPLHFLMVPVLIWVAFRFSVRTTATVALLHAGIAIWGTVHGLGPFARGSTHESLLLVQAFLVVVTPMALTLAAGVGERVRAEQALRDAHTDLDLKVTRRTMELTEANRALKEEVLARRTAEEATQREREFSQCLIRSSPEGILAFDLAYRYTVWNPGMEAISGMPEREVIGKEAFTLFPFLKELGEDRYFAAALSGQTIIARDRPYRIPETGRHGFFEGYYSPIRNEGGDIIGGLAIIRDITEHRRITDALRASEARFRSVIESAHDAIVVADHRGAIILWNAAAERMFGYAESETLHKPLTILMPTRFREAHAAGMERLQAGGPPAIIGRTVAMAGLRRDGTEFPIELVVNHWGTGEQTCYSGIIRDMTDRVHTEEALRQAQSELERRVADRTEQLAATNAALQEKITDLETFHDVVVGRELKMIELEEEIKRLSTLLKRKDRPGLSRT